MKIKKPSIQRRVRYPMPGYIRDALSFSHLVEAYMERPVYQQNYYVGWITRAKRPETREKRLSQMLAELKIGDMYMGMAWKLREKARSGES